MEFKIKLSGKYVHPVEGTKFKYVINSPAFAKSVANGNFSYPITFPNNSENRKVFRFVDLEDLFDEDKKFDCQIFVSDTLIVYGVFQLTKSTRFFVTGNLINSEYDLFNTLKNDYTTDLSTLYQNTFASEYDKWQWLYDTVNYSFPDRPVVMFPVINTENNSVSVTDSNGVQYNLTIGNYVNGMQETDPGVLEFGVPNRIAFPYLAYLFEKIFEHYSFFIDYNLLRQGELAKLVLLNFLKVSSTRHELDPGGAVFNLADHILKVKIIDLLDGINSMIGSSIFFDFITKRVSLVSLKDLLIPDTSVDWYIDMTSKVLSMVEKQYSDDIDGFFLFHKFNDSAMDQKQSEYDFGQSLSPDYTVDNFEDLPVNPTENEIAYVLADDSWYSYSRIGKTEGELEWRFLTWDFFGKKTLKGETDKPATLTPAGMLWYDRTSTNFGYQAGRLDNIWMIPQVGVKPIDNWYSWKFNEIDARTVFYRGIQKGKDDNGYWNVDYPFGTSGMHDAQGNVIGSLQLKWDGPNGLYENYWKEWLSVISKGKIYLFKFQMNIVDFLKLDLKKQVKIGNNFYLIKKITLDIPLNDGVKAELVRI